MKTILFDLDGTLLPIQHEQFFHDYIKTISGYCGKLVDPQLFAQVLLDATYKMVKNDGTKTNEEVFMSHFLPALALKKEEIYPQLEDFYATQFGTLKKHTSPSEISGRIIEEALKKGWRIVLATNPLFPRMAIDERMDWVKIKDYPWHYVTSYEYSRACKPNLLYYQDLVDKLNLNPQECWMIGNDRTEDMVAGKLGFSTFLVTDNCIGDGNNMPPPSRQGSREELFRHIRDNL